jgi:menaquinol-cytochrome c reductase iron-sulfur subunit
LSKQAAGASEGARHTIYSAYDMPGTPEEVSRRQFMAKATLTLGGIIGVGLVIPIVGSLLSPSSSGAHGTWDPLTAEEFKTLQDATSKPVKLTFTLKSKDAYLPEQSSEEYVWGIKTDPAKFQAARPDIYDGPGGKYDVAYNPINLGFVIFSPICPHLGCRFNWVGTANKFECPCHGSQFSFEGEHLAGPAPRGLDPLPFQEQSGTAEIMWIRYQSSIPNRIVISYQS